jgi:hypothetical protein
VSMAALEDGGIRFSYRMDDTPLSPRETHSVEQRIRIPQAVGANGGGIPWTRAIRARLLGLDGRPLAEVESEIAMDSLPDPSGTGVGSGSTLRTSVDRLGSVQLGMTAAEVRSTVPEARDTSWSQEGLRQDGILIPLSANGRALAALDGDSVIRIEVRDTAVRTPERVGVGSTFQELRAAYGAPCADVGEGVVVVWFENAPGISFALDTSVSQNLDQLRRDPDTTIPGGARVTRWWVRRGVDGCPR